MRNICRTVDDFLENLRIELSPLSFVTEKEVSPAQLEFTRTHHRRRCLSCLSWYSPIFNSGGILPDVQACHCGTKGRTLHPIHRDSVFLSQFSEPIGDDKRNAVRFNAVVAVSAVITTEEGEYLLECTENMGIDYHDSTNEMTGSEKAALVVAKIKEFCQTNGLTVRPGNVSY